MSAKFKFLLFYFLGWVSFLELMRLFFMLYHWDKTILLDVSTSLSTYWHGLQMDIAVAAYILLPVCFFVGLSLFFHFFRRLFIYQAYTVLVLFLISIVTLIDVEIYNAWGSRIDATILTFLKTPKEAFASISHLPLFLLFTLFLLAYGLFYFLFRFLLKFIFFQQQQKQIVLTGFALLFFSAFLIIPMRGGLQQTPINQSSVYFSKNGFANHAAVNAVWNLLHSILSDGASHKNPYQFLTKEEAGRVVDSLYESGNGHQQWLQVKGDTAVNVLFIIWESFSDKVVHAAIDTKEVAPYFNQLKKEGIYFTNNYASGDRTYKGLPAILSGYPALPKTTVIHSPSKMEKLPSLALDFKEKGYTTSFYYGGETEFSNIKAYLLHSQFDPIIGKEDFDEKDMNSKWGAHDDVVASRLLGDLKRTKEPFFTTWLTLSSHEPYETPVPVVFPGKDYTTQFLNAHHYTDEVVGTFIEECKKQPWWNNTLVIITGDHGYGLPPTGKRADDFKTPMLWLGGALLKQGVVIDKVVSQLDIATTLNKQLKVSTTVFPFSRNVADTTLQPWAFFDFNNGFGFVDASGRIIYDNIGKMVLQQEGNVGEKQEKAGQALLQSVYDDFLRK